MSNEITNIFTVVIGMVGILLTLFGLIIPFYKNIRIKYLEKKENRFKKYHNVIHELVVGSDEEFHKSKQMAYIYELTKYYEYYDLSLKVIEDYRQNRDYVNIHTDHNGLLVEVIELSLFEIRKKKKWYWKLWNTLF